MITKSASQEICWQKWEGVNLLEYLVAVIKSVCQEICWQTLGKGKSAGRFSYCHQTASWEIL